MMPSEYLEIESDLKGALDNHILSERKEFGRWSNWAGDLGFACDRYQVLSRLHPELKPLPDLGLLKIFRVSSLMEDPNLELMKKAGIKVVEQQRSYAWREKEISGRIDARVDIERLAGRVPLEHKALSPNLFRTVLKHKEEGIPLTKSKLSYLRKYPGQLSAYALMDGSEHGVWFYFEKSSGDYFFWILPLDLCYAEELVQRAERTNASVRSGEIPAAARIDLCERCEFSKTSCFTGLAGGEGFEIILDDADLEEALRRRADLEASAHEFKELDEDIKQRFRGKEAIVGADPGWMIRSKPYETSKIVLPTPELKAAYSVKYTAYRATIERLEKK
jgi:hypothetical protein